MAAVQLAMFGCVRHWPSVQGIADHRLVDHSRSVGSLDILPLDVDFAVAVNDRGSVDQIIERFQAATLGTVKRELAGRGYRVRAEVEWDGSYVDPYGEVASALDAGAVDATATSLRGYGYAQSQTGGELLFPYLPNRLGELTGADTTLYIGGWAYVGKRRTSTGAKVAKGVLIGAVIVIVVVAAIASLKKGGGGGGSLLGGVGRAAGNGAKVVSHSARLLARTAGAGGKALARTGAATMRVTARTALEVLDAFGRSNTHIHIYFGGDPDEYQRRVPRDGYSRMQIEMTLVDNADGRALWHARQQFEADAASVRDTDEVMRRMLASLPAQR